MKHSRLSLFVASVVASLAVVSTAAQGQTRFQDKDLVSTQLTRSTGKVFALTQVGTCEQGGSFPASDNVTISAKGPVLEIRGADSAGAPWSAKLRVNGPSCTVLQGDLDNNGRPDLVIYAPGISDRGAYGTTLSILLFDKNGEPFPWQATGRFTLVEGGIQELRQDSKGTILFETSELGLPAWGGISLVSNLYRFEDSRVVTSNNTLQGVEFPHVVSQNQGDAKIAHMVSSINLSTDVVPPGTGSPVQNADAKFVRYGAPSNAPVTSASPAPAAVGQGANPAVNLSAVSGAENQITVSDGSRMELPDVLVLDRANGIRQIVFHPEQADLQPMATETYRIHPTGLNCTGPDDCEPFILWAK